MVVCNWLIQVVISWQFNYWYQRWFAIFSCVDVAESNLPKIGWFSPQNDQALVHDCQDDGEGAAAKGHAALLKFASSSSKAVLTACKGTSWIPLLVFLGSNDSIMVWWSNTQKVG